jgi:ferrochelatase
MEKSASRSGKTAVVLLQLGGPDSLHEVEPFLYNLFMDPEILNFAFSFILRRPLARFITARRSVKVREKYAAIGGGSPINNTTRLQAAALEELLAICGMNANVLVAMRYCSPTIAETVLKIKDGIFERIVLLPLYPQFSRATTGSSINEWKKQSEKYRLNTETRLVRSYPGHPLLLEAFAENISRTLLKFEGTKKEAMDLIFSAHGLPESYIRKGDPYKEHVDKTVNGILKFGKWDISHMVCYQSRLGPYKWLKPSLTETVEMLAREGRKNLLIVPVSFVSDHLETLHEIDIELRGHA